MVVMWHLFGCVHSYVFYRHYMAICQDVKAGYVYWNFSNTIQWRAPLGCSDN